MKNPKSHLQEGIGGQGTLPAWGHCREWGLSVPSLQGWREWMELWWLLASGLFSSA